MRLIYVDEAGTAANEPVCVVCGIIIQPDTEYDLLVAEIERIMDRCVPDHLREGFHLHATDIYNGKRPFREGWAFKDRLDFLKEMICLPFVLDIPIAVFMEFKLDWNDVIERLKFPLTSTQYSHWMTFTHCMERADHFLRQYLEGKERGVVVAEDVPAMRDFLRKAGLLNRQVHFHFTEDMLRPERWQRETGVKPKPYVDRVEHIIDVPHFVEKGDAPILQLADLCAFAFRRCLNRQRHGDELLLAMLGPFMGPQFLQDDVWFSGTSGGLFNVSLDLMRAHFERENAIE